MCIWLLLHSYIAHTLYILLIFYWFGKMIFVRMVFWKNDYSRGNIIGNSVFVKWSFWKTYGYTYIFNVNIILSRVYFHIDQRVTTINDKQLHRQKQTEHSLILQINKKNNILLYNNQSIGFAQIQKNIENLLLYAWFLF